MSSLYSIQEPLLWGPLGSFAEVMGQRSRLEIKSQSIVKKDGRYILNADSNILLSKEAAQKDLDVPMQK